MDTNDSMEVIIRSVDDAIFTLENGNMLEEADTVELSDKTRLTVTEKKMPLDSDVYFFIGMAVASITGIGKNVLTSLLTDWIKKLIEKWSKKKKDPVIEKPIAILLFDNIQMEFWISGTEIEIRQIQNH